MKHLAATKQQQERKLSYILYSYYQTLTGSTKKLYLLLRSMHSASYAITYYFKIFFLCIFLALVDILKAYRNKIFKHSKWWLCKCWISTFPVEFTRKTWKLKSCSITQSAFPNVALFYLCPTTIMYSSLANSIFAPQCPGKYCNRQRAKPETFFILCSYL